ncbi:hypothetical protein M0812_24530 [Anaeramoeba flamelloides]|uniref:Adenosine kinase n=1 Tax=Anaeramoeba flamelloides TaxID=1746091 RepID=A0AAV7YP04_9EUKA|nr:hypothetical protein M0812_24530 [Anaeramoeba flamelloides]|eukprot:Anaeramoba_flamelloidesa1054618_1189.p1 GENE.a1054618_1189~~a1054618_1189.p1  ORF type:complete len:363 (-),score=100.62 a1054618_1189:290-1378(-)
MENLIMGMGNPLLDISAQVPEEILTKYGIKAGNAILAEEKHMPLYQELVENYEVEYIAGGATQNSIRVSQWMLQHEGATWYTGAVGNDKFGKQLENSAKSDGVKPLYYKVEDHETGSCAACIYQGERSLVANLGAANHFKINHLETELLQKHIEATKVFYISSFFLTVSPESTMLIAEHCLKNNKYFCMNISATFLTKDPFFPHMKKLIPYWDCIVGNETEAVALGEAMGWIDSNLEDEKAKISKIPEVMEKLGNWDKLNTNRTRTVIVTQGAKNTLVYNKDENDGKVWSFPVTKCPKEEFVDSNGAGDSFVGGYLSQLALYVKDDRKINIPKCIDAGGFAAGYIIRRNGCTLGERPTYQFD